MPPTDPSRAHTAAVKTLLEGAGYDVAVARPVIPDAQTTYPYLVLWPGPGVRAYTNLELSTVDLRVAFRVNAFGRDVDEVLAALDRAADQLTGQTLVVAGRTCGVVDQVPLGTPVRIDDTVHTHDGRPIHMGVAQYRTLSTPD